MKPTRTYAEWSKQAPLKARVREGLRDLYVTNLSLGKRIDRSTDWIRFPFYHHVFEDEKTGFRDQLTYLKNYGEFVSLNDALSLVTNTGPLNGRYFCLTFDDGLKSCHWGATPILSDLNIPAAFYLVTSMIGRSFEPTDPIARNTFSFKGRDTTLDFLSWEECQEMVSAGMTIGSHTVNHARLSVLTDEQCLAELTQSKTEIEQRLGLECDHFCAPYGNPDTDFKISHHGNLAQSIGYKTFVTGQRGPTRKGDSPLSIKRDHVMANWGIHQLRYFLSID